MTGADTLARCGRLADAGARVVDHAGTVAVRHGIVSLTVHATPAGGHVAQVVASHGVDLSGPDNLALWLCGAARSLRKLADAARHGAPDPRTPADTDDDKDPA